MSVIGHHDRYAMTALALGDQRLWVGKLDAAEGNSMRIRINAADVSLALQPPHSSSIRNILPVKVAECLDVDGQVDVKLAIGEQWLWARITPWARDELGLKPGQWVYAQIKVCHLTARMALYQIEWCRFCVGTTMMNLSL